MSDNQYALDEFKECTVFCEFPKGTVIYELRADDDFIYASSNAGVYRITGQGEYELIEGSGPFENKRG